MEIHYRRGKGYKTTLYRGCTKLDEQNRGGVGALVVIYYILTFFGYAVLIIESLCKVPEVNILLSKEVVRVTPVDFQWVLNWYAKDIIGVLYEIGVFISPIIITLIVVVSTLKGCRLGYRKFKKYSTILNKIKGE